MTSAAVSATTDLERQDDFGAPAEPEAVRYTRVLVFSIAGRRHCARLGSVREIIHLLPTTPLPGAAAHVRGLINLRGNIVTVLDASIAEYGVPSSGPDASILLVELGSRVAGVVVDEVHDIGLLEKDVPLDALLDLSALVQMALA
jgi:purine-binding chemotaxis protein CheW